MNRMSGVRDLMRIGVLLIGVSLMVFAALAVHMYFFRIMAAPYQQRPFSAYCDDMAIVISASRDISDVRVLDNQTRVVCSFDKIPAGSEELCLVDSHGFYVVQSGDYNDVVRCEQRAFVEPKPFYD